MTILIVDDEFRIGQLIRRLIHFEELGLELIDVFDDSEKALGAILLHHPDVVISDIKMPGMDGLELVRRTQEAGIASRFVFVSGFREFEYAHKALQYGVEDYLLKPVKERRSEQYSSETERWSRAGAAASAGRKTVARRSAPGPLYPGI